ncbi:hypothetical protein PoB_007482300 [Plakobranchus ocellatus]|uniref:Uncharacterized protein n=1 Tax=Plakobranchus ocellatus TaxID=259542 RepID=A0AAV4DVP0_9GAST|nr:hypothetical protein PoB_007482300 [Plakobranchus ocellatus]
MTISPRVLKTFSRMMLNIVGGGSDQKVTKCRVDVGGYLKFRSLGQQINLDASSIDRRKLYCATGIMSDRQVSCSIERASGTFWKTRSQKSMKVRESFCSKAL